MCLTYVQYYIYKRRGIEMFSLLLFFFCLLYSCWVLLFCVCVLVFYVVVVVVGRGVCIQNVSSCLSHFVFVFCFVLSVYVDALFDFPLSTAYFFLFPFFITFIFLACVCVICVCFSSLYRSLNILFAYNWIFACALFFLFCARALFAQQGFCLCEWVCCLFRWMVSFYSMTSVDAVLVFVCSCSTQSLSACLNIWINVLDFHSVYFHCFSMFPFFFA